MKKRIIRFSDQQFNSQVDHGGIGEVLSSRARKKGVDVQCNFIDCVVVPPGSSIGVHTHQKDNEELYIMLSGSGIMTLEEEEHEVTPGDVIINPPGGTHGLKNTGATDIRLVVVEYSV